MSTMYDINHLVESLKKERDELTAKIAELQGILWSDAAAQIPEFDDKPMVKQLEYMIGYQTLLLHRLRHAFAYQKVQSANEQKEST